MSGAKVARLKGAVMGDDYEGARTEWVRSICGVEFLLRSRCTSGWDTSTLSWEGGRRKERKGNENLLFLGELVHWMVVVGF